ncbi:MAG: hypothetical protein EU531_07395 [Promethearchaeota archaeon]|nr:MAG: hypothetical protein EU531_07395 [Candidatus Lokiarchaeota archaeon]
MSPNNLFYAFNFIVKNIIMSYSLIYDLKYRRIPNTFFKYISIIVLFFNFIDFILSSYSVAIFFIIKFLTLYFMVFITFILFNLKIFGGADAKLVIILFLLIPINFFYFSLIFKYLILFFVFQTVYIIINFINNYCRSKYLFKQFFMINCKISKLNRFYLMLFYKFSNYSDLDLLDDCKFLVKDYNLYFNFKDEKFQVLTQFRPPLILLIIIIYYFLFII